MFQMSEAGVKNVLAVKPRPSFDHNESAEKW